MSAHVDLSDWTPRWQMTGSTLGAYLEFRASLEELGCCCLECLDAGLPCYHEENDGMAVVLDALLEAKERREVQAAQGERR